MTQYGVKFVKNSSRQPNLNVVNKTVVTQADQRMENSFIDYE
jgi:hypothetical protein